MESPEVSDEGPCSPASTRKTRSTVRSRIWESLLAITIPIWSCTGSAASGIWETGSTVACTIAKACLAVASGIWKTGSTVAFMIARACYAVAYLIWKAGTFVAVKWERAFVLSCIAVSLDPLFLYIPIVDETNKCLNMDKTLRTTALVLRTLTDFLLLTHIVAEICQCIQDQKDKEYYLSTDKYLSTDYPKYLSEDSNPHSEYDKEFDRDPEALCIYPVKSFVDTKLPWLTLSVIIKLLAIIPVPQVAILRGFFRMTGSDFYVIRKFLNIALVLQYLPRVCQIYLTKRQFRMGGKWPQPLFNLYLYILAGHVLGSLWYFVAIERETSCWHKACKKIAGCVITSTYNCGGSGSTRNITLLNQLCPINSPNSTLFDFGIFVDVLQSGNTESDKFATKLFYSLWWGLKNLSNFGTNLETSNYLWENCFAILICVIGLLLFLYLIGNVQLYIQSATQNSLKKEESRTAKINDTYNDITKWMKERFQDVDGPGIKIKQRARIKIKRDIREDKVVEKNLIHDVDVKYFLKPSRIRNSVLEHVGVDALKKVPMLQALGDTKLISLSQKMKPVVRISNAATSHFVKPEDPLDQMLFIIGGHIQVNSIGQVAMSFYGTEILEWVSFNTGRSYRDPLPCSTELVEPYRGKLEALALNAWELLHFLEDDQFDINNHPEAKKLADSYQKKKLTDACDKNNYHEEDSRITAPADTWIFPPLGWVKLNCCYVQHPNTNKAFCGFVLRNDKQDFIAAGGGTYKFIDSFEAGALSIQRCLRSSMKYLKTSQIVVESDDKLLIDFLKDWSSHSDDKRVRDILRPTLQNIANDIQKFKCHKFEHCKRQANEAALRVAEHARVSGSKEWEKAEEIPGLVDTLKKDSPRPEQNQDLPQEVNDSGASPSAGAAHRLEDIIQDKSQEA